MSDDTNQADTAEELNNIPEVVEPVSNPMILEDDNGNVIHTDER